MIISTLNLLRRSLLLRVLRRRNRDGMCTMTGVVHERQAGRPVAELIQNVVCTPLALKETMQQVRMIDASINSIFVTNSLRCHRRSCRR